MVQKREANSKSMPGAAEDFADETAAPPTAPTSHDTQAGDEETEDGLDAYDEAARSAAEDIPASERTRDVPVFDRGDEPDKI